MKILYIAPLPPPITGQSLVSKVLLDDISTWSQVDVIDLKKKNFKEGLDGVSRILEIASVLKKVFLKHRSSSVVYITVAESLAGNLKDLLIYFLCFFRLKTVVIHLHGGTIREKLWIRRRVLFRINRFFIGKLGAVIISGNSHQEIFNDFVEPERIYIIPNFSLDYLFVNKALINKKFMFSDNTIKVLYMSHMIPKKGYMKLLDAFFLLDNVTRDNFRIDFVGAFDTDKEKEEFINKIENQKNIRYHGVVNDQNKKILFQDAHIFCLPTSYLEGQPISILEAYASGCVILTTGQPGILDIFEHKKNGFLILPEPESIASALVEINKKKQDLEQIGLNNNSQACSLYRIQKYAHSIRLVLEKVDIQNKI